MKLLHAMGELRILLMQVQEPYGTLRPVWAKADEIVAEIKGMSDKAMEQVIAPGRQA